MFTKPGIQTSEFWVTLAQLAISALTLFGVLDPPAAVATGAVVAGGVAAGGYAVARGVAKRQPR